MRKALIVDDSKTARRALCLLLERIGFEVDMLESAEQALEYLRLRTGDQAPDLIFMDHLMPGMDGFQAVKAIKSDTRIADIPIIMYTGRDGEVYFGQAHALGAADILNKPARAEDLQAVLDRLAAKAQPPEPAPVAVRPHPVAEPEPAIAVGVPEYILPEPVAIAASAASASAGPEPISHDPTPVLQPETGTRRRPGWRPVAWVAVALLPALWLLSLYLPAEQERQQLLERERQLYRTLEWGLNQSGTYPWGEPAIHGQRLERLQSLVSQLSALGFNGLIRLKVHVGDFCLLADGRGGWSIAPPALPLTECGALGLPETEALALSEYQGSAFTHFIEESPLLADDRIRIEWMGFGSAIPREDYPRHAERMSAADWNAIAARNQRFELELLPSAAGMAQRLGAQVVSR